MYIWVKQIKTFSEHGKRETPEKEKKNLRREPTNTDTGFSEWAARRRMNANTHTHTQLDTGKSTLNDNNNPEILHY